MPSIKLNDTLITDASYPYFIAEAGINHQGDVNKAKHLIDIAVDAKADAVKFQKRTVSRILTKGGLEAPYNSKNAFAPTYGKHKEALELTFDEFRELKAYADEKGIAFTASGWDEESVDFLDSLDVPFFKMASADLTNFPLLEHTAKKQRPMIISTGMSDEATVIRAYEHIYKINKQIIVLQCCSAYPCPPEATNLRVIRTYQSLFPASLIGYSGHESDAVPTLLSVAMGAKVIERHFTFDKTAKGSDHGASLEPTELTQLIHDIRKASECLGSPTKKFQEIEKPCFRKLAKSLVSNSAIPKGTIVRKDHLTTKGPATGISPMELTSYIGKTASRDIPEDIILQETDFE